MMAPLVSHVDDLAINPAGAASHLDRRASPVMSLQLPVITSAIHRCLLGPLLATKRLTSPSLTTLKITSVTHLPLLSYPLVLHLETHGA